MWESIVGSSMALDTLVNFVFINCYFPHCVMLPHLPFFFFPIEEPSRSKWHRINHLIPLRSIRNGRPKTCPRTSKRNYKQSRRLLKGSFCFLMHLPKGSSTGMKKAHQESKVTRKSSSLVKAELFVCVSTSAKQSL